MPEFPASPTAIASGSRSLPGARCATPTAEPVSSSRCYRVQTTPPTQARQTTRVQRKISSAGPSLARAHIKNKFWCTGEDSNLRSSGERQIYSLLPLTTRPPVHSRPRAITGSASNLCGSHCAAIAFRGRLFAGNTGVNQESAQTCFRLCWRKEKSSKWNASGRKFLSAQCLLQKSATRQQSHRGETRCLYWSWRRDLNPRPSDYKSDALPAELRQHKSKPR